MSSLWTNQVTYQPNKLEKPSPAYQNKIESFARNSHPLKRINTGETIERISLFTCVNKKYSGSRISSSSSRGSMTVEAAVVLPLILFFFLNLTSVIEWMRLHGNLELALWETGRRMSIYGYAAETFGGEFNYQLQETDSILNSLAGVLITSAYARSEVIDYVGGNYLENSPLTDGSEGLHFIESVFQPERDCIDLKVTYRVSSWTPIPGFQTVTLANRFCSKIWTGYKIPGSEPSKADEYVYVTEYGVVYHISLDCSFLKHSIQKVSLYQIPNLYNSNRERYTLCWLCRDKEYTNLVYITKDGNRYHYTLECSGLKRKIHTLSRSEAEKKYRSCPRCVDK